MDARFAHQQGVVLPLKQTPRLSGVIPKTLAFILLASEEVQASKTLETLLFQGFFHLAGEEDEHLDGQARIRQISLDFLALFRRKEAHRRVIQTDDAKSMHIIGQLHWRWKAAGNHSAQDADSVSEATSIPYADDSA